MHLNEYQRRAAATDQAPKVDSEKDEDPAILIPLLGLAGEVGELTSEYKKRLRDGPSYSTFHLRVAEELGDLLWYVSNLATKFNLSLDEVAAGNLEKVERRWMAVPSKVLFDEGYPPEEQFPRQFDIDLSLDENGKAVVFMSEQQLGDPLTDNAYEPDGYRFHDVFHLTYAAMLGWSPVIRALMKRKRKSNPVTDEVEDGARARILEEGIAAMVFSRLKQENLLSDVQGVRYDMLRTIKALTSHLEVSIRTEGEWERAIVRSFQVWDEVEKKGGGKLHLDLEERTITLV